MVDTEQRTARILQECLEAIQSGDETLESVLSLYPDMEEELRPELENATWLMSHQDVLEPDPEFIKSSRQRLMARIKAEQRQAVAAPSWKESILAFFRMPPVVLRAAVTVLLAVVLLMGADRMVETTSTTIPGDPGYTLKRTVENVTLAVSSDPGQQVVLYLEYSQRRLTEVSALVDQARYDQANNTLTDFEQQVRSAVSSLDNVRDEDTVHKELLAMTIQEKLADHTRQLSALMPKVPEMNKTAVQRAMMVSNDGAVVAQTAIKRLMTMFTPQPGQASPAVSQPVLSSPAAGVTPTESGILAPPFPTPTEEYRQIYSSTVAPVVPTNPPRPIGPQPTYPVIGPTATPMPPTATQPVLPTDIPVDTPVPPNTATPVPPANTDTPEPTLIGVSTATPNPVLPDTSTPTNPSTSSAPSSTETPPSSSSPSETPTPQPAQMQ